MTIRPGPPPEVPGFFASGGAVSLPIQFVFSGNPTINIGLSEDQVQQLITAALEATVTAPLANVDDLLTALQAQVANLQTAEAADRAAFDALAAAVRAFIASAQAGGNLTAEQQATAQSILDTIGASTAAETQEAADEAALQGEVPA